MVNHCLRASTSVCAKNFPFYTSKTYFFYFTHLFLQNTSLSIIYIYSNKIFIFLTLWTVTMRGERNEKRVRWKEEREKKNNKIIYMVDSNHVYIHSYCLFARPLCIFRHFYKDWCGGVFGLKYVKLNTFCILEDYPWVGVVALINSYKTLLQQILLWNECEQNCQSWDICNVVNHLLLCCEDIILGKIPKLSAWLHRMIFKMIKVKVTLIA